jgi:DHA1 family bicyclomycin/chloramphenicol resistance-like MFS transporter
MLAGALWLSTPLVLALVCFFVLMTAQGLMIPNGGALASAAVPEHPGTGSAVQGFVQWAPPESSPRSPASAANTPPYRWRP